MTMAAASPIALHHAGVHAARGVSAKSLHIRVYPASVSLAESREILNVLRQYGEVSTYRSLKWEHTNAAPNTSLAIFCDAAAAQRLLEESPLRFTLEPMARPPIEGGGRGTDSSLLEMYKSLEARHAGSTDRQHDGSTGSSYAPESRDPSAPQESQTTASTAEEWQHAPDFAPDRPRIEQRPPRHFLVHAKPWTSSFDGILARAPYTGPFVLDSRSAAQQDLVRRVPVPGLSMIELGREPVPARIAAKRHAALAQRLTLRELMKSGDGGAAIDGVPDALGDVAPDGKGGFIGRGEVARRAAGNFSSPDQGGRVSMLDGVADAFGTVRSTVDEAPVRSRASEARVRRRRPEWSRSHERMI